MRCPACGVETGGPGPSCAVCGTYLRTPPPLPAEPVAGARRVQRNDDYQAVNDKRQRAKDGRAAVKYGSWLLAAIAAVVAGVLTHPGSQSSSSLLAYTQLSAGDCLTGSNLGLDNDNKPWPAEVTAVPCTHLHLAEVFFAGNVWSQSLPYPGYKAITDQGYARCLSAFRAYDWVANSESAFSITYAAPDAATWSTGDRREACMAYQADPGTASGAVPVNYSIKGSDS